MPRRKRGPGRKPGEPPGRFKKTTGSADAKKNPKKKSAKTNQGQKTQRPIIPFLQSDRILLVGEGKPSRFVKNLSVNQKNVHSGFPGRVDMPEC